MSCAGNKVAGERTRLAPMLFAAIYALLVPLALGVFALWFPLKTSGVETLKEWQSLVAGGLAILAALLGGCFIVYQTGESLRLEAARLNRQHAGARAVLGLALSGLMDYAEELASELERLRSTANALGVLSNPPAPFVVPKINWEDIGRLRDVIETASDDVSDRVAILISDIQIMDARIRDLPPKLVAHSSSLFLIGNLDDYLVSTATIHARCSELFSYARRETHDAPRSFPGVESLQNSLALLGFDDFMHDELFKIATARATRLGQPLKL